MVEPCMAFVKKNIRLGARIGEIYREERWEYPLAAVREAIINAVIHRDYSILGSDIKIAIFDDLLEITSPGVLPSTLAPEELGTGRSEIRNRVLAPIFKDLKLIEAWGTGIQRMRKELLGYPEIDLVLREAGPAFQVQFVKKWEFDFASESETGMASNMIRTSTGQVPDKIGSIEHSKPEMFKILAFSRKEQSVKEMMAFLGLKHRETFLNNYLHPLLRQGLIARTIPDKPKSPKQRYITTPKGLQILA